MTEKKHLIKHTNPKKKIKSKNKTEKMIIEFFVKKILTKYNQYQIDK